MANQLRFSLRNLLVAIFWFSVWLGTLTAMYHATLGDPDGWPVPFIIAATAVVWFLAFAPPFFATAALLGQSRTSLCVGFVLAWIGVGILLVKMAVNVE